MTLRLPRGTPQACREKAGTGASCCAARWTFCCSPAWSTGCESFGTCRNVPRGTFAFKAGTLYPALHHLEKQGWLGAEVQPSTTGLTRQVHLTPVVAENAQGFRFIRDEITGQPERSEQEKR
ncbi:helix-turn-helix transcriptional regulator [Deinococcus hopiensis]|uniref:helix-turn-helix transcriptional regulator n=1 Tax=Deinococcus hopiensis TaxID=309885 RepID=UPI003CCBC72D